MTVSNTKSAHNTKLTDETLGLTAREQEVLICVLKLSLSSKQPTLHAVTDMLSSIDSQRVTSNWVYKCLHKLERCHFIKVDRLHRPNYYFVDRSILQDGARENWTRKINKIRRDIQQLETEIKILESARAETLASYLYRQLGGTTYSSGTRIVSGETCLRSSVIREIIESTGDGTIIRTCMSEPLLYIMNESYIDTINELLKMIVSRKMELRIMLVPKEGNIDRFQRQIRWIVTQIESINNNMISGDWLKVRIYPQDVKTYRMICIDNKKMILCLSTVYPIERALIVDSNDNRYMIEDAVRTFDRRWCKAIEVKL